MHEFPRIPECGGVTVKIDGVTKVYATRRQVVPALADVSLDIASHEFVSIVGPSGCGKSTLMLLVGGLIPPSGGTITIDGAVITGPHSDVGVVFQRSALLEWRTAIDNVLLQCEVRSLPLREYRGRAANLLRGVGLGGFEDSYPRQLSGGMAQRVAICRAMIHGAPLLLMDEPFGALDAITRDELCMQLLRLWEEDRKTVIFVTHSVPEAVLLSDRVIVMSPRPGRVEADIPVTLPRPRSLAMATDSLEFNALVRQIREVFLNSHVLTEVSE